ncbi:unnamed protein product [Mytilus edulis]|uniref:Novel STAND NTPase 3 domain-containing protein n=1 Tax=Mytilus edulis TaxID=6550 RepID=A0A8S3Q7V4_MYTED|nr:unnamed protein product [Mytilus edulis]
MNPSPRDNFYRCMTLIVDNGNEAAWDLLDYYLSNQGTTLKDFIENNQHEIYHLCYNYGGCCRCKYGTVNKPKSRILYQSQLDILLDTKGSNIPCTVHIRAKPTCSHTVNDHFANPNIVTKQLDLTLCRCLLFNFTNILPQGSVERNAFEDLINMRNKCCHAAKGEISSKDYQTYKAQIEKCLMALAQVYGKTHDMQLKIKDAEKRPLDESICKQLQQTILQEQVLQGVSGLHKHIKSSQKAEKRTTIEIQKMGKSTKRTLRAVNLKESSERTIQAVESSQKSVEHSSANIEKKLDESSKRTIQAVESSQKSIDHSSANIEKKLDEVSKRTILAVESKTSKRSRLLGLTQTEIDGHLKEGTFVETPAVQACIKLLEINSLLVLTGAAGTGKSRNSLEILHQFRVKHPEYETVKLTDLHDFTDVVTTEEKLVILFEDIFGRTNTRANIDREVTASINRVTLHSIVETEPLLGFPEACSLFTRNRKLTRLGLSFFKHPSKYLYEEIEKLRINGIDNNQDRMSYVTLVYICLNEDSLDPEDVDVAKCLEILESCYGVSYKKIPVCQIIDAANGMLGRYLIYHSDNSRYHFQHQTIFESILISYSRIDTGLILSRLSFDFIREMVRLQNYKVREGDSYENISKILFDACKTSYRDYSVRIF